MSLEGTRGTSLSWTTTVWGWRRDRTPKDIPQSSSQPCLPSTLNLFPGGVSVLAGFTHPGQWTQPIRPENSFDSLGVRQ